MHSGLRLKAVQTGEKLHKPSCENLSIPSIAFPVSFRYNADSQKSGPEVRMPIQKPNINKEDSFMARHNNDFGGFGGGNMQQLMRQAQKMQEQLQQAQDKLDEAEYEASAGGGMVSVKVSGKRDNTHAKTKEGRSSLRSRRLKFRWCRRQLRLRLHAGLYRPEAPDPSYDLLSPG